MRTKVALVTLGAVLVSGLTFAVPARANTPAPSPPPAGRVFVDVVTVNGSGCPAGTTAVMMANDNTYFSVLYGNYIAAVGVGATATDFRKQCQTILVFHIPPGYTFAISQTQHGGYAHVAAGAIATERAREYRQGDSAPALKPHTFTGPFDTEWQATDTQENPPTYYPCGTPPTVVLDTELRVSVGTSDPKTTTSFIAFDTIDVGPGYGSTYQLDWATC